MRKRILFPLATLLMLLASCIQLTPFTGEIQKKYKLSESDLKGLQFYTSSEIVLYKADANGVAHTVNGELIVEKDRSINKVVIPKGTPGQVVHVYPDKLAVSFGENAAMNLLFGSKYIDGHYKLLAREWSKDHGELKYGEEMYFAQPGSGSSYLLIKLQQLEKTQVKEEVLRGRKVTKAY